MAERHAIWLVSPDKRVQVKWMQRGDTEIIVRDHFRGVGQIDGFRRLDANFDDVMTLLGFTYGTEDEESRLEREVVLYWQVGSVRMAMPAPTRGEALSAFVHVTNDDPAQIVAQYDGWDVALRGLQQGDVLIQHVPLSLPPDLRSGTYTVRLGLYSPQTWSRIPVQLDGAVADHVRLDEWQIE